MSEMHQFGKEVGLLLARVAFVFFAVLGFLVFLTGVAQRLGW